MTAPFHSALAKALTGEDIDLGEQEKPDIVLALAQLAQVGWDTARIAELRKQCRVSQQPWPIPVPASARGDISAATWLALVSQAIAQLGITDRAQYARVDRPLTADEQRLVSQVPPHHGSSG
ncbi:MAG: hypothetical protein ACRDAX_07625 [Propionibacteriaceae bacterium]